MPAANRRGRDPAREDVKSGDSASRVPPIKLDLRGLTDKEEVIILEVIKRDERERALLDAKISEIRREIQDLRKAGALVSGDDPAHMCARCKAKIAVGGASRILPWVGGERAERCVVCKFLVCPKCRSRQPKGNWICVLCLKCRQEKLLTGEWVNKGQSSEPQGSDLLRMSLRDRSKGRQLFLLNIQTELLRLARLPMRREEPHASAASQKLGWPRSPRAKSLADHDLCELKAWLTTISAS
ncbi:synaptotagmin-like 4 [Plakobranchus ocellatus]|uniref:Synaptotagmin-like 4 n=1 Tax=Plakobranchus ocellatus TaxID=259542 RepID=A0AAV4AYK4_9GAST|nr:synaptotagmin-like 4 [Plakobranchus ocellatus]